MIVPGVSHVILSVKKLIKNNCKVIFNKFNMRIICGKQVWECFQQNGLFVSKGSIIAEKVLACTCLVDDKSLWHKWLGHLNRKSLQIMNLTVTSESCMKSKLTIPFKTHIKPRSN